MRYPLIVLVAAVFATPVQSQQYPIRPVRMIVPFAPGGAVDVVARIAAVGMTDAFGQQVVVDNRGGGGGVIGTDMTVQARGDGYTLLLHSAAITSEPALRAKLPYDAMRDLAPITLVGVTPNLLVAHPAFPAKSARDLIAMAKEKPGMVTYGTGGVGSSSHLAVELFGIVSGTRFNHVPFKGAGPAVAAVVAGELNFTIAPMPASISLVRAGRLRALGVSGLKRSPAAEDIPTIAETGLPGYEFVAWFGLLVPAATPPKLVQHLASEVRKVVNAPDTRGKMEAQGFEPQTNSPAEFREHILKETDKWRKVITQAGIKAS
jgi:tripartite-type tricarboxylate transporter receptor subunit TctC